jgi:hypothetical protein
MRRYCQQLLRNAAATPAAAPPLSTPAIATAALAGDPAYRRRFCHSQCSHFSAACEVGGSHQNRLPVQVQKSSVDRIIASRNETSGVGAEEQRQRRDFFRLAHAADGLQLRELLHHLLLASGIVLAQESIDEWGMHTRGGDAVAADVVVDIIACNGIRHREHRAFAHAVSEAVGESGESGNGGEIQNHASARSFHRLERRVHAVVHALYVDAVNAIELVFRRVLQLPDMGYAGIVHEDIDGVSGGNSPEDLFDLLLIRNIAERPLGFPSSIANLLCGLFCVLLIDFNNVD